MLLRRFSCRQKMRCLAALDDFRTLKAINHLSLNQSFSVLRRAIHSAKRHYRSIVGHAYAIYQAPTRLLELKPTTQIQLCEYVAGSDTYQAVGADKAKIFTNRRDNIAIVQGKSLVPYVSLQHHAGRLLSDKDNFILTRKLQLRYPPVYFQGTILSLLTGEGANYNYYHWFFDSIARIVIAESLMEKEAFLRYLVPDDTFGFQRDSLRHLGITQDRWISSAKVSFLSADRIIATTPSNPRPEEFPLWILDFLRDRFLSLATVTGHMSLIYVSRNDSTNSRRLLNEIDLWRRLAHIGFTKVELSTLSLKDQVSLFANAKMIVSVHGAGLTNLAFSSKGTIVYELFAESFQPQMYRRISEKLQLQYHSVICPTRDSNPQSANLTISDNDIESIAEAGCLASRELNAEFR